MSDADAVENQRHIRPWGGTFYWLDRALDDDVRRVFVYLLLAGQPVPMRMEDIAKTLRMHVRQVAKALFLLNRYECVSVLNQWQDVSWHAEGLAGVDEDLTNIARPGQSMVLATFDGMPLAHIGVSITEATEIAARPRGFEDGVWQSQPLRAGSRGFVLWWDKELEIRSPGLLRLLTRMLHMHGETPFTLDGQSPDEEMPMITDANTSQTSIVDVLMKYSTDCPALTGAVVATPDGLLLGATPSFGGDAPAAVAVGMLGRLEQDLQMIMPTHVQESLLWADPGVWYTCRLPTGHVLLGHAADENMAGSLRLAGQVAAKRLAPLMPEEG